jgi:hypothetical protein
MQAVGDDEDAGANAEDEMLIAQIQDKSKRRVEATKACCQVMVFLAFLLLFSVMISVDASPYERYQQRKITRHFHKPWSSSVGPEEVNTIPKFFEYLEKGFYIGLFGNETNRNAEQEKVVDPLPPIGGDEKNPNLLLGAVEMRQLRVTKGRQADGTCGAVLPYAEGGFVECAPAYTRQTEYKQPLEPNQNPHEWQPAGTRTPMPGVFATYEGGGYVVYLNGNRTYTAELLDGLKEDKFFDMTTRAIMLDFNLWNPNLELYSVCRLMFEISPIGVWSYDVRVLIVRMRFLKFSGDGSSFEWIMAICEALLALFVLYYIAEEVSEFWVSSEEYLKDGWNFVDWSNLLLLLCQFYVKIVNYYEGTEVRPGMDEKDDYQTYNDMQIFGERIATGRQLNAFNVVLIWLKVVKYVPFLPYQQVLKELFTGSGTLFVSFFCIFVIFFVGFGLAFNVGFGMENDELSSWGIAWVYLGRSLLGDVDVTNVYEADPTAGTILIFAFIIGIYMILMNMWYGLICHAFSQTRETILDQQEKQKAANEPNSDEMVAELFSGAVQMVKSYDYARIVKRFPGLYARTIQKWRRTARELDKRKAKRHKIERERMKNQLLDRAKAGFTLMPYNQSAVGAEPDFNVGVSRLGIGKVTENGEMVARGSGGTDEEDVASVISDESMDLGPLSPMKYEAKVKWRKRVGLDPKIVPDLFELTNAIDALGTQVLGRLRHVGSDVREEMCETREVFAGINNVLNVVNTRLKDLDVTQRQHL